MNIVTLGGRLGKKPEAKDIGNDNWVSNVSIATTDYYGKNDPQHTNWHNLVVWGANARFLEKYMDKGSYIVVTGELRYRTYEVEGVTKYFTEIKVARLDAPKPKGAATDPGGSPAPIPGATPVATAPPASPATPYTPSHLNDDVPF